jgi:hypothetical protein
MRLKNLGSAVLPSTLLIALLAAGPWSQPAFAGPMPIGGIEQPVIVNGEEIGFLDIRSVGTPGGDQALIGFFQVEKQNPGGSRMTLKELENNLGEDHLQWFQKVTSDTDPPLDARGNRLKAPYIDPPPDGYSTPAPGQWADELPWFLDERAPTQAELAGRDWNPDTLLANNTLNSTGTLLYTDGPTGTRGNKVSFATFLVSVNNDNTYTPLAGFSWSVEFGGGGLPGDTTYISSLTANAPFTAEYAAEIFDQFGWTAVPAPEPSTAVLLGIGLAGLGLGGRKRRPRPPTPRTETTASPPWSAGPRVSVGLRRDADE